MIDKMHDFFSPHTAYHLFEPEITSSSSSPQIRKSFPAFFTIPREQKYRCRDILAANILQETTPTQCPGHQMSPCPKPKQHFKKVQHFKISSEMTASQLSPHRQPSDCCSSRLGRLWNLAALPSLFLNMNVSLGTSTCER